MSTMSTRFPYKERRVGKITKIGLTRSSSTPSNPYGSRTEACQPQPVIFAACQGAGMIPSRGRQPVKQGPVVDRLSGFPNSLYKRKKKNFYSLLSIEGDRPGHLVSVTPPVACCRPMVTAMPCSTNRRLGLTRLSPTASRHEGGGCQPCQPDFRDFFLPSLFIGKSH